jgi:asparagine synthase (glutamine-hydrolysing)
MSHIVGAFWTQHHPKNTFYESALIQKIQPLKGINPPVLRLPCDGGFIALEVDSQDRNTSDSIVFPFFYGVGHVYAKPESYASYCYQENLGHSRPTNLNDLKHTYWGRYVGALIHKNEKALSLIRDPLGLLSLYWMRLPFGYVFSSKISFLVDVFKKHVTVNDRYFQDFILDGPKKSLLTPFSPILEVQPGCELTFTIKKDPQYVYFWNPASIIQKKISPFQTCPKNIYEEMINRLLYSLKCWVTSIPQICLHLSGGLDSSSLLLLLKHLNVSENVLALNYKHSSFNASDESYEARRVSDFCGASFYGVDWAHHMALRENTHNILWDRPYAGLIMQETTHEVVSDICTKGNYGFMDGQGGDHLFLMPPPVRSMFDAFRDWGIRGTAQTMNYLTTYYRRSIWVLAKRFLYAFKIKQEIPDWLKIESSKTPTGDETWSFNSTGLYWGKKDHVNLLQESVFYRDLPQQYGTHLMTHPLLSLPFVEYILSLPTYIFFNETYDRIFFREAVNHKVPNPFVWRKTKGETTSVMIEGLRQNFEYVRGLCLEGYFAQKGLIEQDELYQALLDFRHSKPTDTRNLMNLIVAEIWFKNWSLT